MRDSLNKTISTYANHCYQDFFLLTCPNWRAARSPTVMPFRLLNGRHDESKADG